MFSVWRSLLGLCDKTVLEDVEFDEAGQVVVAHVRPKSRATRRCGRCGRRSPRFDHVDGRRRWRGLVDYLSGLGLVTKTATDAPGVELPRC